MLSQGGWGGGASLLEGAKASPACPSGGSCMKVYEEEYVRILTVA